MFGLGEKEKEKDKGKRKESETLFDLEIDLLGSVKRAEVEKRIRGRMLEVKDLLRAGLDEKEFNQFGHLLYGYAALLKVVTRFKRDS